MYFSRVFSVAVFSAMMFLECSRARAATPIEFEFGGVYTQVTGTNHQIGEPFTTTVRFDPFTMDVDPSPLIGRYGYLTWTVPGPATQPGNQTLVFNNNPISAADIRVILGDQQEQWRLEFRGATLGYGITLEFPPGTFSTDALPTNLPLSQAFTREFGGGDGIFPMPPTFTLRGSVESLTVRVPEPIGSGTLLLLSLVGARRRH